MKETILAISGKPGLYRLVARGNGNLIVESIDEQKRRITAGSRDRVTSLRDVSMYTMDDDKPLMEVFESIKEKYRGLCADGRIFPVPCYSDCRGILLRVA